MEPSDPTREVLVAAEGDPIGSLDLLLDRCVPALTAHLWQTCCWSDSPALWNIGDFRYSIVEFEPVPEVPLYIQLWSEPEEPALVEVSSGHRSPRALKYVWRSQRKVLEQHGFAVGGAARNFQKELVISSPEDAEGLAREMLAIFFDVFGYRGDRPLTMTLHSGSRSERRLVHTSLSPEDFTKIVERSGFRAALVVAESRSPVVTFQRGRFKSIAILGSPIARSNLFGAVLLRTVVRDRFSRPLPNPAGLPEFPTARFDLDRDGRVIAESSLGFDGGVTTDWLAKHLERWRQAVRKYQRLLRNSSRHTVRRVGAVKRGMSVH